ncbi:nickel pincer cofactor biosynthesis protein LarC [Effusibacillus pohliae]|uniref:nickel pincer cofactor biosynthesis protein LarC n=1 Tax=Effusibacillus pohliae TaxID=232270 RepID=UPI00036BFE85|nr:nickel pincer cofactor biosynthesis protein LarC [Effusibacillus pohliae]
MKTLYLDCISGISGDMTLAALIDLGADLCFIKEHLRRLPIDPFEMRVETVVKRGIAAKKLRLEIGSHHHHEHHHHEHHHHEHHHHEHHHHEHRPASQILEMIERSELPPRVKQRSHAIFHAIAMAEGKIHGIDPRDVHFHEVGAMDSILDMIGVCLALESLGIDEIYASPVPTGHGKVRMEHGLYPIPAPATAELLTGIPLADLAVEGELTTPTGAGILKALVKHFGPLRSLTIERIGYGAGEKEFDHPNVLRAILLKKQIESVRGGDGHPLVRECQQADEHRSVEASGQLPDDRSLVTVSIGDGREPIFVLEAQLDDLTGEALGYAMDRLFEAGALDVFYTPVYMKKNRPGTLVTVLASTEAADRCELTLLTETSTLGVRRTLWTRRVLDRRFHVAETAYGPIRVKQAFLQDKMVHQAPEYEDVAKAARQYGVPFHEVYQAALAGGGKDKARKEVSPCSENV